MDGGVETAKGFEGLGDGVFDVCFVSNVAAEDEAGALFLGKGFKLFPGFTVIFQGGDSAAKC